MKNIIERLKKLIPSAGNSEEGRFKFQAVGFHGDLYLLSLVDLLMSNCSIFVETGANVGTTLAYVAKKFPRIQCYSCEPDAMAYRYARRNTHQLRNVRLYNESSQVFLKRLINDGLSSDGDVLFWLDAHGYGFEWPLIEEIDRITTNWKKAYILIDDFRVPHLDCFGYDEYDGQVCSFEYIEASLSRANDYRLYYPSYSDKTSEHHPLRGWGLIEYGHEEALVFGQGLVNKVKKQEVKSKGV